MPRVKLGVQILPFEDLKVPAPGERFLTLNTDEVDYVLALLQGQGPTNPRIIQTDDSGHILLGDPGARIGAASVADDPALSAILARVAQAGDGMGVGPGLFTNSFLRLWNGVSFDRLRGASASGMATASGVGVAMAAPPGMWSVVSTPAAGVQATATKAAGGAGVRHVCTGIVVTWGAIAAPVATALTWNLRDGASGAGTILASGQLAVPAAVFQGQPVVISDIALLGTAATAMTLEFSGLLANLLEGVTLTGFDAS